MHISENKNKRTTVEYYEIDFIFVQNVRIFQYFIISDNK